jgi:hypothetical protein
MRKILFLILLVGAGYWAYHRHTVSGARLSCPTAVAWEHIPPASQQFIETAAILDSRWRVEITRVRNPIVAVFDGSSFASTHPKATAQQLDPRPNLQQLYANLPSTAGVPIERLGASDCWHFTQIRGATAAGVWVDTDTRFVRKVSGRANGIDTTDIYELLPLDVKAEAKRLFDTKNLQILLSR